MIGIRGIEPDTIFAFRDDASFSSCLYPESETGSNGTIGTSLMRRVGRAEPCKRVMGVN